jgi:TonB-linked SusC/RagA family outer membrane protein
MIKFLRKPLCVFFICLALFISVDKIYANERPAISERALILSFMGKDTIRKDTTKHYKDSIAVAKTIKYKIDHIEGSARTVDTVPLSRTGLLPLISIQQLIKGNVAGAYVQENSGEPGSAQSMVIHGLSSPVFSNKDLYGVQPTVFLNGIPLIQDHPYNYNIQQYDYKPIGPATNLLAGISPDNIQSIEVIKDPLELAKLGPQAANGAIYIVTKNAKTGYRTIEVNSYYGMVTKPTDISPVNAGYVNQFREQFYNKYATAAQKATYPSYLGDATNSNYYGPAQWSDLYYKTSPVYNIDLSIAGGSDRANFRFFGGQTSDKGNADNTSFTRSSAAFFINMAPYSWLTVSSMISASRTSRDPNKSLRDRYAETGYLPDLSTPLPPSKDVYQSFLTQYDNAIDNNITNAVQGYLALNFNFFKINYTTKIAFDYNEGIRDLFYPMAIMDNINYVSNYFGYNQRAMWINSLNYKYKPNEANTFTFDAGATVQGDIHRYNYSQAYHGLNDFVKVASSSAGFVIRRYTDKELLNLYSVYGSVKYNYKDLLEVNAMLRDDGASNVQPDHSWLITPAFNAKWNIRNQFLGKSQAINQLSAGISWSKIGRLLTQDQFAAGPQYTVDLGWNQNPDISSYNSYAALSRPYVAGWIGYGLGWSYSDQAAVNLDGSFFNNRLQVSLSLYDRKDKQQVISVPVPREYGYTSTWLQGMAVDNKGVDATINIAVIKSKENFNWSTSFNVNVNRNELTALPNGLSELVVGDRKLQVGKSVDQFWLLENNGIYNNTSDVPVNPTDNKPLSYKGVALKGGDPRWKDQNGDFVIDDNDKVLTGHSMPALTGGWNNQFRYKNFDLNINMFFAVGQKALNVKAANEYDFINQGNSNTINAVQEIFSWQKDVNLSKYPIYNPWSSVVPYRQDQNLFLENASYVKLRSVTLGYDLSKVLFKKGSIGIKKAYIYATASNLLTITRFSGSDPELIDFNGNYSGYGLPIPRSFILGIKLNL